MPGTTALGKRTALGRPDDARYFQSGQILAGQRWAFDGDSITYGTGATFGQQWAYLLPQALGTSRMRQVYGTPVVQTSAYPPAAYQSVDIGVAGQTSTAILARLTADLAAVGDIQGITLLAGTNDIAQGVPIATWQANIIAFVKQCRRAGIPVVLATIPPWGVSRTTAATRKQIIAMNLWLKIWTQRAGVPLADIWTALADPTTGDYVTTYDSGDGIHPSNSGHLAIARVVAAAISPLIPAATPMLVTGGTGIGAAANPLMTGTIGATRPSSWSEASGGTGTQPTYNTLASTDGLIAGQWAEMDFDGTAAGGTRALTSVLNTASLTPGDLAMLSAQVEIIDVAGYAASTSSVSLGLTNGANTLLYATSGPIGPFLGTMPVCVFFTVPPAVTSAVLRYQITIPTGVHGKFRLGACNVYDLGALSSIDLTVH